MVRHASRLFLFSIACTFSFCTPRVKEAESDLSDSTEIIQQMLDSAVAADSASASAEAAPEDEDTVVASLMEEEEPEPYAFDTAGVPVAHSMDKAKWEKAVGSLDYSEKEMPKEKKKARTKSAPFDFSGWGKGLIVLVVLALLGILIWRLLAAPPVLPEDKEKFSMIFGERHPDQMDADELDALLKKCLEEGNYRNAIRVLYLMSLKYFSEKELIRWNREKTNRNYILELSGTSYQENFSRLTLWYDSAWYGEHPISREQFEIVQGLAGQMLGQTAKTTPG